MKRILAMILVLLAITGCAFADTISVDLNSATEEELKIARDAIDAKLMEIRLANATTLDDTYLIKGNGTQILNSFELTAPISRFVATCDKDTKVTLYIDGKDSPNTYGEYGESQSSYSSYFVNPHTITSMMVESQGNWEFDFSPLVMMDSPYTSGTGSYVTDMFTVSPPCIVTFSFRTSRYSQLCSVVLHSIDTNGKIGYESVIPWGTYVSDSDSFDIIIKPEPNIAAYFWEISCSADVDWKISAK